MKPMEESEQYHPIVNALSYAERYNHSVYPPRLMVDFTKIGRKALERYVQVYHLDISMKERYATEELAALVARHFDNSLDVDEDDSILTFIQRVRNGEKTRGSKRSMEKNDKKQKKSSSRKRQRGDCANSHVSYRDSAYTSTNYPSATNAIYEDIDSLSRTNDTEITHLHSLRNANAGYINTTKQSHFKSENGSQMKKSDMKKSGRMAVETAEEDNDLYCICSRPSFGNMIACDGKTCPNPSQWYHLECVGLLDGRHPNTWFCPECDPKAFAAAMSKRKKNKSSRSKSPGALK